MSFKYLHEVAPGVYYLDHRLTPEVSGMFAAMSSRLPSGGIKARYEQIVEAVAEGIFTTEGGEWSFVHAYPEGPRPGTWEEAKTHPHAGAVYADFPKRTVADKARSQAEDRLCGYPIHPKVQGFFDKFVKAYGHSSVMELTGNPAVYTEGISWYTAYLLFDSPLCAGQEFSTRAVRHKDWPMARECYVQTKGMYGVGEPEHVGKISPRVDIPIDGPLPEGFADIEMKDVVIDHPHPTLQALHDAWFEVFEAEVNWWKDFFSVAENRTAYGIKDKEPFRPALDRARWAIPGTFSTGCCHTGHLRERARVLHDGLLLAQRSGSKANIKVWEGIRAGYAQALPGLAGMGLREAVYDKSSRIPGHMHVKTVPPGPQAAVAFYPREDAVTDLGTMDIFSREKGERAYVDPWFNHIAQVGITFQCSLAVCRDWHRHRTVYPWSLDMVRETDGPLMLHPSYEPKSELGISKLPELLAASTEAYDTFMADNNQVQAMLAIPLGTRVQMSGTAGLRDALYLLELRANAVGANFEYEAQARTALASLGEKIQGWSGVLAKHLGV